MANVFSSGLDYRIADDLDDVVAAWHLVYQRYLLAGLIDPNEQELHATTHAIQEQSLVAIGSINGAIASTLTIMPDGPRSLPLDSVYRSEIDDLRAEGRKLLEVGLLADRREEIKRYINSLMCMFMYPWFFARYTGSDIICGVHPHHAEFYEKAFGFVQYGPARAYPKVKDHPVTLLRLDIEGSLVTERLPRATKIYIENPLPECAFDHHFNLADPSVAESRIGAYLRGLA
jgi:hypothetical protein